MTSLTFNSLNSGGKWGKKSGSIYKTVPFGASDGDSENPIIATVEAAARKRLDELLQDVPEDRKSPGEVVSVDSPGGQAIMRAYLDLVNAAHALNTAEYNGSALDLGLKEFVWNRSTGAATTWCFVFSAFVGIVFVLVAVLISIWGFDVHGVPTNNITALAAYIDGVQVSSSPNMTCSIEAQNTFKLDKFLGYPDTNVFWNLYGGLVLGLIFGFLDNFGLFYGMGALDSFFYGFGSKVAAGLMSLFRPNAKSSADAAELLIDLHTVTSDLMAGLGNTFSGARRQVPPSLLIHADPHVLLRRPSGCCPWHRRPRNRQGWTKRGPGLLGARPGGHRARLPPRVFYARPRETQGASWRQIKRQLDCNNRLDQHLWTFCGGLPRGSAIPYVQRDLRSDCLH